MLHLSRSDSHFIAADSAYEKSKAVIVGFPMDLTVTGRHGTGSAPKMIRDASYLLETYSPAQKRDLTDLKLSDIGDMELPFSLNESLEIISKIAHAIISDNKKIISLGGEHLISLPIISEIQKRYKDIAVIHIDAHLDMAESYLGIKLSHASVMRRVSEIIGMENIYQIGQRSGTKEEWGLPGREALLYPFDLAGMEKIVDILGKRAVYITVDLDVLDPSVLPGTGTPEPAGANYTDLVNALTVCRSLNIVGFDIVELAPALDISGASNIVAAGILKEALLLFI